MVDRNALRKPISGMAGKELLSDAKFDKLGLLFDEAMEKDPKDGSVSWGGFDLHCSTRMPSNITLKDAAALALDVIPSALREFGVEMGEDRYEATLHSLSEKRAYWYFGFKEVNGQEAGSWDALSPENRQAFTDAFAAINAKIREAHARSVEGLKAGK